MSQLDPTYKFFLEAGIVVLVMAFLCLLVGGGVFVAWRWIRYSDNALKAKKEGREADDKAKKDDMALEEIRLKMVGELASQISKLSERISDDREQDRLIREKELIAVDKLVESVEKNTTLLKSHTDESHVFRSTMTTNSNAMLTAIADANAGITANTTAINSVKTELEEFKSALIALPNTIQSILSPYCERMESALAKLETIQVEEKDHVPTVENLPDSHPIHLAGNPLVVHPSLHADANESPNPNQPLSNGNGEGSGHNQPVSPGEIPSGNPASESNTGSPATD